MDRRTIASYDEQSAAFAADWESQPAPVDLYALFRRYLIAGPTADIGCGSGRDAAWLQANGWPVQGYDASEGLLREARRLHPEVRFSIAALPGLDAVPEAAFANVVCETVLMHLPHDEIASAVEKLRRVLQPSGVLYLSWRITTAQDRRDEQGRLYAAFDPRLVVDALDAMEILYDEQVDSVSSGKRVRRLVARAREVSSR